LNINKYTDASAKYAGAVLTWSIVTDKHKLLQANQENKERLESTVLTIASETNQSASFLKNNVTAIAAATEELVASIGEISSRTRHASEQTTITAQGSKTAQDTIQSLQKQSEDIGKIIQTVTSIANQTNLLALNATIEAARAGDAGKGFAVVANEVKELANQTAAATKEIQSKIKAIQNQTHKALEVIDKSSSSITELNGVMLTIASSVEEQNAIVEEIGSNMRHAQNGVSEVADSVSNIVTSVQENINMLA
jgi:methyl-accepting chemotaxis protein